MVEKLVEKVFGEDQWECDGESWSLKLIEEGLCKRRAEVAFEARGVNTDFFTSYLTSYPRDVHKWLANGWGDR